MRPRYPSVCNEYINFAKVPNDPVPGLFDTRLRGGVIFVCMQLWFPQSSVCGFLDEVLYRLLRAVLAQVDYSTVGSRERKGIKNLLAKSL